MILGLGTDIVNIDRVANVLAKFGPHFLRKVYTAAEQREIDSFAPDNAKRAAKAAKIFAAKEAAVKALGTGDSQGVSWQEVELGHDELGKPLLHLSGKAAERLRELAGTPAQILVSVSDDHPFAQAVVIIEKI